MSEPTTKPGPGPQRVSDAPRTGSSAPSREFFPVLRAVIEIASLLAILGTVWFLYLEVKTARKALEHQVMALEQQVMLHKQNLTDIWIQRFQSKMEQVGETQRYLSDPEKPEKEKIDHISKNHDFQRKVNESLSCLEEIAVLYNLDALHKERISKGPRGAILSYWKASRFWIEYRQRTNPRLYVELASMVDQLEREAKP